MKILVSTIIPVYNSGEFLEECIISLRNQTLQEIEMIFVNDGSTDNSLDILKKYQVMDNRIKVISQKNSGPSAARNRGIELAKGEYISFIDSDDWIDKNMYEVMYNLSKDGKIDLIVCDIISVENKMEIYEQILNETIHEYDKNMIKEYMISWLMENSRYNSMANKLFRRKLIEDNNIKLEEDSDYAEDWMFNIDFLKLAETASYINKGFYYYRRGHESSSRRYDENTFNRKGIWLYKQRKKYGPKLGFTGYEGSNELIDIFKDCIINSCKIKVNNTKYIRKLVNLPEIQESVKHVNKNNLSSSSKLVILFIKLKLSLVLCIYSNICNNKSNRNSKKNKIQKLGGKKWNW